MNSINIADIAKSTASDTVKALAVAQKMNMINTEEDLTELIKAGIEAALEELIAKLEENKTTDHEI